MKKLSFVALTALSLAPTPGLDLALGSHTTIGHTTAVAIIIVTIAVAAMVRSARSLAVLEAH